MEPIKEFQGEHRFLSNFWPASVQLDGEWYPSVEHAYVAAKTLDLNARAAIAQVPMPGQVKKMGRKLVLRANWEEIKRDVMMELVWQKFSNHPELKEKLIATFPRQLIEGNNWGDTYWGICRGKGHNHLGAILMVVRHRLMTR